MEKFSSKKAILVNVIDMSKIFRQILHFVDRKKVKNHGMNS